MTQSLGRYVFEQVGSHPILTLVLLAIALVSIRVWKAIGPLVSGFIGSIQHPRPKPEVKKKARLDDEQNHECSICITSMSGSQNLSVLPCMHTFHEACIQKWISSNPTCPVCRTRVENDDSNDFEIVNPDISSIDVLGLATTTFVEMVRAMRHQDFASGNHNLARQRFVTETRISPGLLVEPALSTADTVQGSRRNAVSVSNIATPMGCLINEVQQLMTFNSNIGPFQHISGMLNQFLSPEFINLTTTRHSQRQQRIIDN